MQRNQRHLTWVWWFALALPTTAMIWTLIGTDAGPEGEPVTEYLLHPSGETAARLMIIAMALSPLRVLFPRSRLVHWLVRHRRHIGVAAFAYAALHTLLYLVDMATLRAILGEFTAIGIWTGWLALAILIPMAATSNDRLQRGLGRAWKPLQRLVYVAALATLVHWIYVHNNLNAALLHFTPLALLETIRIHRLLRPSIPSNL